MNAPTHPILQEAEQLRDQFQSAILATVNSAGEPEASYTPYLLRDGRFYLFVSGLSAHTGNLMQRGKVSLLFIEDESESRNLFARKRLSYQCEAQALTRMDERWNALLDRFQERFGPTIEMLRQLPDFVLFELTPIRGNFVKGFGQAYFLEGEGLREVRQATGK